MFEFDQNRFKQPSFSSFVGVGCRVSTILKIVIFMLNSEYKHKTLDNILSSLAKCSIHSSLPLYQKIPPHHNLSYTPPPFDPGFQAQLFNKGMLRLFIITNIVFKNLSLKHHSFAFFVGQGRKITTKGSTNKKSYMKIIRLGHSPY